VEKNQQTNMTKMNVQTLEIFGSQLTRSRPMDHESYKHKLVMVGNINIRKFVGQLFGEVKVADVAFPEKNKFSGKL
jgi:hypothetical protein